MMEVRRSNGLKWDLKGQIQRLVHSFRGDRSLQLAGSHTMGAARSAASGNINRKRYNISIIIHKRKEGKGEKEGEGGVSEVKHSNE